MIRVALLALLCGCADAASSPPPDHPQVTKTGDIADPCWPVAPLHLVVHADGRDQIVAEMIGDGSMYALRGGERHFLGRVANDSVLDAHDAPSMTCIHLQVDVVGGGFKGKFDADDAYVDTHTRVAVAEDGALTLTMGTHPPQASGTVEGVTKRTRRTAELLVISALIQ